MPVCRLGDLSSEARWLSFFLGTACLLVTRWAFIVGLTARRLWVDDLRTMEACARVLGELGARLTTRCVFRCTWPMAAEFAGRPTFVCAASTPPSHSLHARIPQARTVTANI